VDKLDLTKEEKLYLINVFVKGLKVKKESSEDNKIRLEIDRQIEALTNMLEML
jgi:hypothetical protein